MPDWITQIDAFARYHLPVGEAAPSLWPAAAAIVIGLILCLAGARLLRAGVVLAFAGAGAALGAQAAVRFDLSTIAGIVLGVIVVGLIGYVLFRLWIALFTGFVALAIAACVTMGPNLATVWQEFEDARISGGAVGDGFALLTAEQQRAARQTDLSRYCRDFLEHVWSRYPGDARRLVVVLAAAFLAGASLGLFAHRWAIVLGTAALGTMLILAGLVPLISRYCPQVVERCDQRPNEVLIVLGIWALIAIVVQRRGLRPAPIPSAPPQPEH